MPLDGTDGSFLAMLVIPNSVDEHFAHNCLNEQWGEGALTLFSRTLGIPPLSVYLTTAAGVLDAHLEHYGTKIGLLGALSLKPPGSNTNGGDLVVPVSGDWVPKAHQFQRVFPETLNVLTTRPRPFTALVCTNRIALYACAVDFEAPTRPESIRLGNPTLGWQLPLSTAEEKFKMRPCAL